MLSQWIRCSLAALLCLAVTPVFADDDDALSKEEIKKEVKSRIVKMSKRITVGPDGKIEVEEINGEGSKMPKEAIDALKKAGINIKNLSDTGKFAIQIMKSSDGEEGDEDDGKHSIETSVNGKIMIVGPDGKEMVHEFGKDGIPFNLDFGDSLRDAMKIHMNFDKDANKALDAAMKEVDKAMAGMGEKIRVRVRNAFDDVEDEIEVRLDAKSEKDSDGDESINTKMLSKLDLILSRLDKLEAEVDALKSKSDK